MDKDIRFLIICFLLPIAVFNLWAGGSQEIEPQVELSSPEVIYISPANQDSIQDNLTIVASAVPRPKGFLKGYALYIYDELGNPVRSIVERDLKKHCFLKPKIPIDIPELILWDGKDEDGNFVGDGKYIYEIRVWDERQVGGSSRRQTVIVDNSSPSALVLVPLPKFSPTGDGVQDTLEVQQFESSYETRWIGRFYSALDSKPVKPVKSHFWNGQVSDFFWDGLDDQGNLVPAGEYIYILTSTDRAGNFFQTSVPEIFVDTTLKPVLIYLSENGFSPNGDGYRDSITLNLRAEAALGIREWRVIIKNREEEEVKTFSGAGSLPASVVWDGKSDLGTILEDQYRGYLFVEYERGLKAEAVTLNTFILDISPPEIEMAASPLPFSPDRDGKSDLLTLETKVQDVSSLSMWRMDILDPQGSLFFTRTGVGHPPKQYQWDGHSDQREMVQSAADYIVMVSVSDRYGNTGKNSILLPIDILVVREGDKLRIIISSINFKAFTADYLDVEPELREKNIKALDNLAFTLKKYPEYRIVIEGHAVALFWDRPPQDREREQRETLMPLSLSRAEAVKAALVERGIEASRITTRGYGGLQPVVPHSDLENRWKNRRVEFILKK